MSSTTSSGRPVNDLIRPGGDFATNIDQDHGIGGSFLGEYYVRIMIGEYKRPVPFQETTFKPNTVLFLPLPTQLSDSTTVDYQKVNLEAVGDAINGAANQGAANVLRSAGNIATGTGQGIAGMASKGLQALNKLQGMAGAMAVDAASQFVNNLYSAENITSAVQQNLGVAPNPNPSVSFQGPSLREFGFTWNLYPRNVQESIAISRLIKVLKSKALPSINGESSAILNYPDMCQLNFYPWDKVGPGDATLGNYWNWTSRSIIKYKKCVITSVNADYTTHGTPAFFEGTQLPVAYQLSIRFQEIEYMLSNNWKDAELPEGMTTTRKSIGVFDTAKGVGVVARDVTAGATRSVGAAGVAAFGTGVAIPIGFGRGLVQGVGDIFSSSPSRTSSSDIVSAIQNK